MIICFHFYMHMAVSQAVQFWRSFHCIFPPWKTSKLQFQVLISYAMFNKFWQPQSRATCIPSWQILALKRSLCPLNIQANFQGGVFMPFFSTFSYMGNAMQKHVLGHMHKVKAQISLHICTVWSGPSLFTNRIVCLCWGFTAQSTQWGHVKCGQFTQPHFYWAGLVL